MNGAANRRSHWELLSLVGFCDGPERPVTPEVAGSSPVGPPISSGSFRKTMGWASVPTRQYTRLHPSVFACQTAWHLGHWFESPIGLSCIAAVRVPAGCGPVDGEEYDSLVAHASKGGQDTVNVTGLVYAVLTVLANLALKSFPVSIAAAVNV
jgi:hypothetical protein